MYLPQFGAVEYHVCHFVCLILENEKDLKLKESFLLPPFCNLLHINRIKAPPTGITSVVFTGPILLFSKLHRQPLEKNALNNAKQWENLMLSACRVSRICTWPEKPIMAIRNKNLAQQPTRKTLTKLCFCGRNLTMFLHWRKENISPCSKWRSWSTSISDFCFHFMYQVVQN